MSPFRSTFCRREDLVSPYCKLNNGKAKHKALCKNSGKNGICHAPCGTCPNGYYNSPPDYLPIKHREGNQMVGVCPPFTNHTSRFLAADLENDTEDRELLTDVDPS